MQRNHVVRNEGSNDGRIISGAETKRVSQALDIIAASPPSRQHALYLGPSGTKAITIYHQDVHTGNTSDTRFYITIEKNSPATKHFFKVGAAYRFPEQWKHKPISLGGAYILVRNLTKADIVNSLKWFAMENANHEMFEIHMGNRAQRGPAAGRHPLEYSRGERVGQRRHSSLLEGAEPPRRAAAYLKKEHPRAMLHYNIVREVARRRAERAAQEEALAAHKAKMDIVHMNLMHRPPIGQLPGGPGYLATGAAFRNRAASSGSNRSKRSNRSSGSKRKRN